MVKGLDSAQQRSVAVDLFNCVWGLLEKSERTPEENDLMLHAAHASRFMWDSIGDHKNRSIGEWQVSRVYATLGRAEPALYHAQRSLHWATLGQVEPFYIACAHEALARAHSLAANQAAFDDAFSQAQELSKSVTDKEDLDILLADLRTLKRPV